MLFQRILLRTGRIDQLLQTVFPRRNRSHGVVLHLLASLPEKLVGGVFGVCVEVYDVDRGGGGGVSAEELTAGGGIQV